MVSASKSPVKWKVQCVASSLMIASSSMAAIGVGVELVGSDRCHYCGRGTIGRHCCQDSHGRAPSRSRTSSQHHIC